MKEIYAVIRSQKIEETKNVLEDGGFSSLTALSVEGRGRQKRLDYEIDPSLAEFESIDQRAVRLKYIPKRMLYMVVEDEEADNAVSIIEKENKMGYPGDGKIFICPLKDAVRIRTGEGGDKALT